MQQKSEVFIFLCVFFLIAALVQQGKTEKVESDLRDAEIKMQQLEKNKQPEPPLISLSENTSKFRFRSGSTELSEEFQKALKFEVAPRVNELLELYGCNTVLITGYTDTARMFRKDGASNSDTHLLDFMTGAEVELSAGSNAELGLFRAAAIFRFFVENRLLNVEPGKIIIQSRAQLYLPGNRLTEYTNQSNPSMRRIEIEVTRSKP